MGIGRDLGKKLLERASSKVSEALSRADVLGGVVRDRVTDKLASLKTPPTVVHSVTPSSPRPATSAPVGLGDPSRPAQVFGRASCPWSGRAVALLESARIEHTYFELDSYGGETVLRDLKLETKQDTVPFVFVRGRFVGGYNALDEIQRLGQLEYLCASEAERVKHPLHGRVQVAERTHDGERFVGA
jgi:glutaredoxin